MTKIELRKKLVGLRKRISRDSVSRKSRQISQKVLDVSLVNSANSLSAYLPINNEVDTRGLIDTLMEKGKSVHVPAYDAKIRGYTFSRFTDWQELVPGPYGIWQPRAVEYFDPSKLDVAIIPGVAFDKNGVRLGYGKGVFDRLLAKSGAFKIGLAYDFQVVEKLPREKHDLVMDLVVTEKRVLVISDK